MIQRNLSWSTHFSGLGSGEVACKMLSIAMRRVANRGSIQVVQMVEKAGVFWQSVLMHMMTCPHESFGWLMGNTTGGPPARDFVSTDAGRLLLW